MFRSVCQRFSNCFDPARVTIQSLTTVVADHAASTLHRRPYPHAIHVLNISNLHEFEVIQILDRAVQLKQSPFLYGDSFKNKVFVHLMNDMAIRDQLSFDSAISQLGGYGISYSANDLASDLHSASVSEAAVVVSAYATMVISHLHRHKDLEDLATYSDIPVINSKDEQGDPCHTLTDLMAIYESKGDLAGLKLAYLGDPTTVQALEMIRASCMLGMSLILADVSNPGTRDSQALSAMRNECKSLSEGGWGSAMITDDALDAIADADVIYTDKWITFDPSEQIYPPFQGKLDLKLSRAMLECASSGALFINSPSTDLACENVAGQMVDGKSITFKQLNNRVHVQKALLLQVAAKRKSVITNPGGFART